jgi:geranylgeranyl pyrophosphate synthase
MLPNLKQYQKIINKIINTFFIENIDNDFIKEMAIHALIGGKRLRSSFALDVYLTTLHHLKMYPNIDNIEQQLTLDNMPIEICYYLISVELLHNTSLILDDLPSMDNDIYRRGQKTIHNQYGRSNAHILASYFLEQSLMFFQKSFSVWEKDLVDDNQMSLIYKLSNHINYFKNMFLKEMLIATEGQYLDLYPETAPMQGNDYWEYYGNNNDIILNMVVMKTGPFYMLAFCGGYLLGRFNYMTKQIIQNNIETDKIEIIMKRTRSRFDKLKNASYQFSYAFQISDDILDIKKDEEKAKKNIMVNNYPLMIGVKRATKKVQTSLVNWKKSLEELFLWSPLTHEIYDYIPDRDK